MNGLDPARLAWFSAAVVAAAWAIYWPRIQQHRVPRRPVLFQAAHAAGAVLAVLALVNGPTAGAMLAAVAALLGAGLFLFSSLTSSLPRKQPAVNVGDRYLDFTAKDWEGRDFRLSSLEGRPFILKFYRGHW